MTKETVLITISLAAAAILSMEFLWSLFVNAIGFLIARITPRSRIRSHWMLRTPPAFCLVQLGVLLMFLGVFFLGIAFLLIFVHPHGLMDEKLFIAGVVLVGVAIGVIASLVRRHVFSARVAGRHASGHPYKDVNEYAIVLTREGADLYSLHVTHKNPRIPSVLHTSDISLKHNPELVIPLVLKRIGPGMRLLLATPNMDLYQAVTNRMHLIRAAVPNQFRPVHFPVNFVVGRWGNRRYKWGQPVSGPYIAMGYIIYT